MTPAEGNANLVGAVFTPVTNWAAHSAARQEALQLGEIINQRAAQKNAETAAASADTEAFLEKARSTPFMGRDKQKLLAHLTAEQKALEKKLVEDYGGNIRLFAKAELPAWKAGASQRLLSQPWYQQAHENTRNVLAAEEAKNKNELLVGNGDLTNFRSGEAELSDFLSGRSDGYSFRGGYKPEDDLKHFREMYAPGKYTWEGGLVPETDKLTHLVDVYGKEMAVDKYMRQHRGLELRYKQDSPLKSVEFEIEKGRYNMAVNADKRSANADQRSAAAFQSGEVLKRQHMALNNQKLAKNQAELTGTSLSGRPFDEDLLSSPNETFRLRHEAGSPKKLPHSGIDLGKVNMMAGVTLFNGADEVLHQQLGLQKTKEGFSRGNIQEGFSADNGTGVFNLKDSRFSVASIDPKLFYSAADNQGGRLNQHGVNGFARVTLQFHSAADAERAGLYNPNRPFFDAGDKNKPTGWFDATTKYGTGVYNPETMQASLYVPVGHVDGQRNKFFMKSIQKAYMGQKPANEAAGDMPYSPSLPFDTNFTTTPYTPRPNL